MYRSDPARPAAGRIACLMLAGLLAACGDADAPAASGTGLPSPGTPATGAAAEASAPGPAADRPSASASAAATTAQASAEGASLASGHRLLEYPDELQMLMLAYRLAGRAPPLEDWAAEQFEVRMADEFSRDAAMRAQRERLQRIYEGTRDVGRLRINVQGRLSEYDPGRGGYYIDAFLPGSVFEYRARPDGSGETVVGLRVSAPAGAEFWPLPPEEAKRILAGVDVLRQVTLDSDVVLSGASERGEGLEIQGRLAGYKVVGSELRGSPPLGERRFPPD